MIEMETKEQKDLEFQGAGSRHQTFYDSQLDTYNQVES